MVVLIRVLCDRELRAPFAILTDLPGDVPPRVLGGAVVVLHFETEAPDSLVPSTPAGPHFGFTIIGLSKSQ